ncbi:hypothetical protein Glove_130g198 [Diversispora epigaea]|uniref:Uncharacterized protein n=1 Tax=Diversispora epigaea TaxID=1348612 RepID=A0A397J0W2_9GLOM|nr:hypothetical protein Glove_130g198 [Diversispora epigaea]
MSIQASSSTNPKYYRSSSDSSLNSQSIIHASNIQKKKPKLNEYYSNGLSIQEKAIKREQRKINYRTTVYPPSLLHRDQCELKIQLRVIANKNTDSKKIEKANRLLSNLQVLYSLQGDATFLVPCSPQLFSYPQQFFSFLQRGNAIDGFRSQS